MYWNHRVMRRINEAGAYYTIEEVYYDENNVVVGWTQSEKVWAETPTALREVLQWMLTALDKPELDEITLEATNPVPNAIEQDLPESEQRVTMDEVLDSLGLEREDVELPSTLGEGESLGFPDEVGPDAGKLPQGLSASFPLTEEDFE